MKFLKVWGQNFLRFGPFSFDLDQRGLVAIQGENRDDPSAISNGAGKSSLIDAICWCLYGSTARGASGDAVVNNKLKKDCQVSVTFVDGPLSYTVHRTRKPASLEFTVADATGAVTDLTKGTERETQEAIVAALGCSEDVFVAAIYAGQEEMPDLPGMTDKHLKLLIEEAAGIELLARAYARATANHSVAKSAVMSAETSVSAAEDSLETMREDMVELRRQQANHAEDRKHRVRSLLEQAQRSKAEYTDLSGRVAGMDKASVESRLNELREQGAKFEQEGIELDELTKALRDEENKVTSLTSSVTFIKRQHDQATTELANIENRIGQPCTACGKPILQEDLADAKKHEAKRCDDIKAQLHEALLKVRDAKERVKPAQEKVQAFKASMSDPTKLVAEIRELEAKMTAIARLESQASSALLQTRRLANEARELQTGGASNPFDSLIESKQAMINEAQTYSADLQTKLKDAEKALGIAADAVKVFGPAGVRAHILDTVTPFLNERTSHYLGVLSDGAISAVWSTLTRTTKGELREKFNIDVDHAHGGNTFKLLSGGEKRKVRLACYMALRDLVATRASKPIDLFMADEIDDALDDAGLERLMGLLEVKARESGTVLVVSHNSLTDWIDNTVTVIKEGGISRLEGCNA